MLRLQWIGVNVVQATLAKATFSCWLEEPGMEPSTLWLIGDLRPELHLLGKCIVVYTIV